MRKLPQKLPQKFIVVVEAGDAEFAVNIEADYFEVTEGFLFFHMKDGSVSPAAFRNWVYVMKSE